MITLCKDQAFSIDFLARTYSVKLLVNTAVLITFVIDGLLLGSVYALVGMGISFTYGVMRMINWAMGQFYMLGSYLQLFLVTMVFKPEYWYLAIITGVVITFGLGYLTFNVVLKPMFTHLGERFDDYANITTILVAILILSFVTAVSGANVYSVPSYFTSVNLLSLNIDGTVLIASAIGILTMFCFFLILKYTWIGMAFRAVSQNRLSAQIVGVEIHRVDAFAFAVGITLSSIAGMLLAPVYLVWPGNGQMFTVIGFVILVIGGLGSLLGSLVAGILLGVTQALGAALVNPSYEQVYGFMLLVVVLLVRPYGLFGKAQRTV